MRMYILDSNVFIEAWNKYYSPEFCDGYFSTLETLGKESRLAIPQMVKSEIEKKSDDLSNWINHANIPILPISVDVQNALKGIFNSNPNHKRLTDTTKHRSMADPWVIAHAIVERAVVVSKEERIVTPGSKKVKIPNVCDNMGIRCIQDFEFISEIKIEFSASLAS